MLEFDRWQAARSMMQHREPLAIRDAFDQRASGYSEKRIQQYNAAMQEYPLARQQERRILIDLLELQPSMTICDVAAGGGFLADGIWEHLRGDCRLICIENSIHFATSLPRQYERINCSLSGLKLPPDSVDRVACLAGLHHQQDKQRFFDEAFRILRPGGLIVIGDVESETAPARFLNSDVDFWSDIGHNGMFFSPGEATGMLAKAGFVDLHEKAYQYTWDFPGYGEMVRFCKTLFRMTKASLADVESALNRHFEILMEPSCARLPWGLVYARGKKPVA